MQSSVRRADERGAVSVLGLFVLTAVLLLALGAVHFMRSGSVLASEYERETQLRLARAASRRRRRSWSNRPRRLTTHLTLQMFPYRRGSSCTSLPRYRRRGSSI